MNDENAKKVKEFVKSREWDQFHTPGNLAKSISIEANELLEIFQWDNDSLKNKDKVQDEIADIQIYLFLLAEKYGIDLELAVKEKVEKNTQNYPVEKSKGNSKKYTELGEK